LRLYGPTLNQYDNGEVIFVRLGNHFANIGAVMVHGISPNPKSAVSQLELVDAVTKRIISAIKQHLV
jgi:hypothetical protein